jgi:hypothetical protein
MTSTRIFTGIWQAIVLASTLLAKPTVAAPPDSDPLFLDRTLLSLEIVAPFARISNERDKDNEYAGVLHYTDDTGQAHQLEIKLSVRGNSRLQRRTCTQPPLWVNFRKQEVEGTLFEHQDKLKLVLQCRESPSYRNFLVKEELAYQLHNALSDISFQTRMAEVRYSDAESGDIDTSLAFFIEHQDRLAQRTKLENTDIHQIEQHTLDPVLSTQASLFMYMIANVDYSFVIGDPDEDDCCHNAKLLQDQNGRYYPVPYDFDVSGFVDATYAEPLRRLGQRNLRDRVYRGFCVEDNVMQQALAGFHENQEHFSSIIGNSPHLDQRSATRAMAFVEQFFDIINETRQFEREILGECR